MEAFQRNDKKKMKQRNEKENRPTRGGKNAARKKIIDKHQKERRMDGRREENERKLDGYEES